MNINDLDKGMMIKMLARKIIQDAPNTGEILHLCSHLADKVLDPKSKCCNESLQMMQDAIFRHLNAGQVTLLISEIMGESYFEDIMDMAKARFEERHNNPGNSSDGHTRH